MKDLVAVNALIEEGRDLWDLGRDYMARCGAKYLQARDAAGGYTLEYRGLLRKAGVAERTERRAIQFAKDPAKVVVHREKEAARLREVRGRTYDRNPPKENKDLPITVSKGEIHEATRGFKAMIRKGALEEDMVKSRERRTVAFAHFKLLLSQSNLPQLMGMSPDEIIELIRTI